MSHRITVTHYSSNGKIATSEKTVGKGRGRIVVKSYSPTQEHNLEQAREAMSVPEIQEKYEQDFFAMLEQK